MCLMETRMIKPNNKYSPTEDKMMFDLREVKINLGSRNMTATEINSTAEKLRKKYNLSQAIELPMAGQSTAHN